MAELSNFTSKFRSQKNNSPSPATKVKKRPQLVCNQCQKSKLRCDRGQPCNSCVKKDLAAFCSYQRPVGPRNGVAEDKLLHLESIVKELMQTDTSPQSGNGLIRTNIASTDVSQEHPEAVGDTRSGKVKTMRYGYAGSTHWSAILDDIHELKAVLGGSADAQEEEEPIVCQLPNLNGELIFGSSNDYSLKQIISNFLPSKLEVDRLLSTYFQGEAFIVPFIHTYHFQSQYRAFWDDTSNVNPLWLSILFSICYLGLLIQRASDVYPAKSDLDNDHLHIAAGQCLILGEYYRPQRYTVEALVMYANCKNLRSLDSSREAGAILGIVVRMAYELGYHRDPDSFGSFTVFEGEMRRRFWATCKQLDMMMSFQLGLPSNICLENCDTKSPRNLLDSDFDADTQVLPPSRSENQATRLLWFIVKERQMVGFSKVCQNALSFKEKPEADIIQLDKEIREMDATIPEVLRTRPLSESIADPPFLVITRIYVNFIHLKCLCVLHRKYMARGNIFSTKSCVEAGKTLVAQFIDMDNEFAPGGQLYMHRWMVSNFIMNDFLLGVMVLCLVVHTRWKRGSQNSAIDDKTETEVLALLEQSHTICVEKSAASRDAKRVSHAVRLTLNEARSWKTRKINASQPSATPSGAGSSTDEGVRFDSTSAMLFPWNSNLQSDEAAFRMLDPFNFLGNDIENMDWTAFDLQM